MHINICSMFQKTDVVTIKVSENIPVPRFDSHRNVEEEKGRLGRSTERPKHDVEVGISNVGTSHTSGTKPQ